MTRVPGVIDVLPQQASGNVTRKRAAQAPLCKTCRKAAGEAPVLETGEAEVAA
jgi:hypothetical protein